MWLCSSHNVTDLAAFVLQDTPGIYEEGPVADSVAKFIKEGNEEYMAFEQVGKSPVIWPSAIALSYLHLVTRLTRVNL